MEAMVAVLLPIVLKPLNFTHDSSATVAPPMQGYTPLRFYKRCGRNIEVLEGGLVLQKYGSVIDGRR